MTDPIDTLPINIPDSFIDELEREGGSYPSVDKHYAEQHTALYRIWAEGQESWLRRHWWQLWRPVTIDTSREAFDRRLFEHRMAELWP